MTWIGSNSGEILDEVVGKQCVRQNQSRDLTSYRTSSELVETFATLGPHVVGFAESTQAWQAALRHNLNLTFPTL